MTHLSIISPILPIGSARKPMQLLFKPDYQCRRLELYGMILCDLHHSWAKSTCRARRARAGHFEMGIHPRGCERAAAYIDKHGWKGRRVAVAVDDTKLHPDLWPMYDPKLGQYVLIGGADGPIPIANPDDYNDILTSNTTTLATKVIHLLIRDQN
jgi:hypothetical protein